MHVLLLFNYCIRTINTNSSRYALIYWQSYHHIWQVDRLNLTFFDAYCVVVAAVGGGFGGDDDGDGAGGIF